MLKIQVLGSGLIPRGHGIAPKKEPFPADLTLIGLILSTPGLKMNYINPETGKLAPLTRENYQKVYQKYPNGTIMKAKVAEGDGIIKELVAFEVPADGVMRDAVINPTAPVAPVAEPDVPQAPPQEEAPVVVKVEEAPAVQKTEDIKAPDKAEDAPAEFSMKPIMAEDKAEDKAKQQQQQNQNRHQHNPNRNNNNR